MELTIFKRLGLSDKETKIYLALLKSGAISVRGLADITGINRGTAYDTLKSLQEQGLVSFYHANTKQKFAAEAPEKLLSLLSAKESELKNIKNEINALIPELNSLKDKGGDKPVTKYYEGKSGIRFILEDVLCSCSSGEKEYVIYSATLASNDIHDAYPSFTRDRIKKRIHVKAISLARGGGLSGLDERKWLGTEDESATFILIYADKIAYISRDAHGMPVGVIIENQEICKTQKIIFTRLWDLLK